jgi:hypothetical protein
MLAALPGDYRYWLGVCTHEDETMGELVGVRVAVWV